MLTSTSMAQLDHPGPAAPPALVQRSLPDHLVPERNGVTVWWSNIKREGEWILPRIFRVFTFMGNVELDLTWARMGEGMSEIEIRCIFANVEISVPPDIRVQCDGDGVMGSFEVIRVGECPLPALDAPTLRVYGGAYMGNVTVKIMGKVGPGWKEKLKAWTSLNA
ncbi:MAG TPA: LiaF domain-containing protein [Gemmatimonadaceae bacterium]